MAKYTACDKDVFKDGMPMPRRLIAVELERGQAAQDLIFRINKNLGANWVQGLADNLAP